MWIEIVAAGKKMNGVIGRGPRGPCGLKSVQIHMIHMAYFVEAREGLVD